jgi:glutathione synthase/RimK-type ligase-like ATP-grasp enzyme
MKQVFLLFAKSSVDKGLADPERLAQLLGDTPSELNVAWAYFDDLIYSVQNDAVQLYDYRNKHQITDYDVVYFRYWGAQEGHAVAAARVCKLLGVPFIDSEVLRTGSQNKITQYVNLYEAKVPIPKTLIAEASLLQAVHTEYGFQMPFIMKDKAGTRGQDNFLVRTPEAMQKIVDVYPEVTFVLQEFIPNTGDYRVVVMGDRVRLLIRREANGDTHLNNTSQGGSAHIVPIETLPTKVLEDCVRASKFYGREVTGVDIVESSETGEYLCFEVNRAPQIEHASFEKEKATLLADYLASL